MSTETTAPVVTRAGQEDTNTQQSGDCIRVSGVGPQYTPATRLWYGEVRNAPGYRSTPTTTAKPRPADG